MKTKIKLFNFLGAPVNFDLLFLILFAVLPVPLCIGIFLAVLIHEMAHAYVADKKGYNVYGIEVSLFHGSASIDNNIHERDSIPVTAAGPLSNLLLYLISFGLSLTIENQFITDFMNINLFLFIFNILPIYPMDGGVIFKDFLVLKSRALNISRLEANKISAIVSLIFSILLVIYSIVSGYLIMCIFAGFFVYQSYMTLEKIKTGRR